MWPSLWTDLRNPLGPNRGEKPGWPPATPQSPAQSPRAPGSSNSFLPSFLPFPPLSPPHLLLLNSYIHVSTSLLYFFYITQHQWHQSLKIHFHQAWQPCTNCTPKPCCPHPPPGNTLWPLPSPLQRHLKGFSSLCLVRFPCTFLRLGWVGNWHSSFCSWLPTPLGFHN